MEMELSGPKIKKVLVFLINLFYKLNQSILLVYKDIESFLLCWMFLTFRYFLLYIKSLLKVL